LPTDDESRSAGALSDVLMALIDAQGAVISKNALIERVWSDRIVEENNLQIQISALRAAFGADRNLIRTVIAGSATPSNAASGKIANSPSPMNFRMWREWVNVCIRQMQI
jgi:hypothetical protein